MKYNLSSLISDTALETVGCYSKSKDDNVYNTYTKRDSRRYRNYFYAYAFQEE
jgi:hypothetical protein